MRLPTLCILLSSVVLALAQGCSKDPTPGPSPSIQPTTDKQPPAPQAGPESPPGSGDGAIIAPTQDPGAAATATGSGGNAAGNTVGATVFQTYCQTCHGTRGEGDGPAATALTPKPSNLAKSEYRYDPNGNGIKGEISDIHAIVRDGTAKYGGSPLMVPWAMLSVEQQLAVATHVKSLASR